jgi:cytochrome c-type biogenesis protein CcmH/NrfF
VSQESDEERRAAEEASRRVNRLSDQLKSPFCPGKTLLTCTSYQAFKLRKEMTQMIAEGKSDPEILAALRDSFGDDIENPIQPWYTAIVPILPFVFGALIALWMFSMWLRGSQRKTGEGEQVAEPEVDEAQRERLKALLRDDL